MHTRKNQNILKYKILNIIT